VAFKESDTQKSFGKREIFTMKAQLLGSTFLSILIGCPCGSKKELDRQHERRCVNCDNCGSCIEVTSLSVTPTKPGELCMHEFAETPERTAIIADLEEAQARLDSARARLSKMTMTERAHKTGNYAQYVSTMKTLLTLDWHDEDARAA
jgi:hypothetical protein